MRSTDEDLATQLLEREINCVEASGERKEGFVIYRSVFAVITNSLPQNKELFAKRSFSPKLITMTYSGFRSLAFHPFQLNKCVFFIWEMLKTAQMGCQ